MNSKRKEVFALVKRALDACGSRGTIWIARSARSYNAGHCLPWPARDECRSFALTQLEELLNLCGDGWRVYFSEDGAEPPEYCWLWPPLAKLFEEPEPTAPAEEDLRDSSGQRVTLAVVSYRAEEEPVAPAAETRQESRRETLAELRERMEAESVEVSYSEPCARLILALLEETQRRHTAFSIATEFARRDIEWSTRTIERTAHALRVKGVLDNTRRPDSRGVGYGLVEWREREVGNEEEP